MREFHDFEMSVLKALGLQDRHVISLDLHLGVNEVPMVTVVEYLVDELDTVTGTYQLVEV